MLSNFFFTAILISSIFSAYSYNSHLLCLDHQKSLLLQVKNELIFDSSFSTKLVQWNQTHDCCNWNGVDCDSAGHVISLQLDDDSISGGFGDTSSLFRLKYLEKLNLAYNDFNHSTPIPKGIHRLNYLTHLNLSNAGFGGQVPIELSFLTRLVSLDISIYLYEIETLLVLDNLEVLVRNLTGLRELCLDGVNITSSYERRKWSQIVSSYLPHLTTFSCAHCSLSGPFARSFSQLHSLSTLQLDLNDLSAPVPAFFANFSSLITLSLVSCGLKGSFPNMIFHIPTLQNLDLSQNDQLSGSLPPFTHNGSLQSVRLGGTNFSGLIPSSISNLKNLSELFLSGCKFTGSIFPSTFANLTQLTSLDLRVNLFTGSLSPTLFQGLSNLVHVDLSYNLFTGSLSPTLFQGLSNLVHVNLGFNSFSGNIPHSLFALPSLESLSLGGNHFTRVEEFSVAINVSNIDSLDLSGNQLGEFSDSLVQLQSLANLTQLDLSRNNLRIDFPDFIKHLGMIKWLDLSNNGIGGEIPSWIWGLTQLQGLNLSHNLVTGLQKPYKIPSSLDTLDLSSNQLRGELSLLIPPYTSNYLIPPYISNYLSLRTLLLHNNSFSGSIPTSLCTAINLDFLDLSVNKLSGSIPSCLLAMSSLSAIDLRQNNLRGPVPDTFSPNCNLAYFDLNNNTLHGKLPRSINYCEELAYMNVGNNIINDTFPCMLPSSLRVLALHSNSFHGEVTSCDHNSWPHLQILDISSNHFSGSLEQINFSSWKAMVQASDSQLGNRISHAIINGALQPGKPIVHGKTGRMRSKKCDYENFCRNEGYGMVYRSGMTLIMKGLQLELYTLWSDFNTIDLSSNNFRGEIPNAIADLTSLYLLNLSHNALNGSIPKSFGKLGNLESLDLSRNQLTGAIPTDLAGLTFLQVLNLSYNNLVGEIPNGRQLQTFTADSYKGNPWLCGFPLDRNCSSHSVDDNSDLSHENEEGKKEEIEWEYVSAALGYVVGLGSIVWLLLFYQSFRKKCFDKIEEVVEDMFDARDMRRRRRASARRRAVRNEAVMRRRQ